MSQCFCERDFCRVSPGRVHERIAVLPYPVNLIAEADTDPYRLCDCCLINQKSGPCTFRDKGTGMMLTHMFAENSLKGSEKSGDESRFQTFGKPGNLCQCSASKGGFIKERLGVPVIVDKRHEFQGRFALILKPYQAALVYLAHSALNRSFARVVNVFLPQGSCSEMPESVKIIHSSFVPGSRRTR